MDSSKEDSSQNAIESQNEITHEQLEWHLLAAQESLERAQELDRRLYSVARFSKRISGAVNSVNGCLHDAEILQRCGSLGSTSSRDSD
jgi:hypothetical protein